MTGNASVFVSGDFEMQDLATLRLNRKMKVKRPAQFARPRARRYDHGVRADEFFRNLHTDNARRRNVARPQFLTVP